MPLWCGRSSRTESSGTSWISKAAAARYLRATYQQTWCSGTTTAASKYGSFLGNDTSTSSRWGAKRRSFTSCRQPGSYGACAAAEGESAACAGQARERNQPSCSCVGSRAAASEDSAPGWCPAGPLRGRPRDFAGPGFRTCRGLSRRRGPQWPEVCTRGVQGGWCCKHCHRPTSCDFTRSQHRHLAVQDAG